MRTHHRNGSYTTDLYYMGTQRSHIPGVNTANPPLQPLITGRERLAQPPVTDDFADNGQSTI